VSRSEFAVSPLVPDTADAGREEKPKKRARALPTEDRTHRIPSLTSDTGPEAKIQKLKKKKEKKKKKQASGTDLSDLFDSIA